MEATTSTTTEIRPFTIEIGRGAAGGPPPPHPRDALADQGARRRPLAGRAAGDDPGARPLLERRVRLAQVRGEAERAAAVHDRDRRGRDPLHPRAVAARGRAAADHDARLARLGHRAARDDRPAHRPDRARRHAPRTRSTWCCRRCPATASPASRPSSAGTPAASRSAWAELMRRLGYTRYVAQGGDVGRRRHRRDGPPGARGAGRHPRQPARGGARASCDHLPAQSEQERAAHDALARSGRRLRLLPGAVHPAADDRLLPAGFTRRAGGLDARPRHRQLLQDLPRVRRRRSRRATSPGTTSSTTSRCTG